MATHPDQALAQGSPALASLMLAHGTAIAQRALPGRSLLVRARRRDRTR